MEFDKLSKQQIVDYLKTQGVMATTRPRKAVLVELAKEKFEDAVMTALDAFVFTPPPMEGCMCDDCLCDDCARGDCVEAKKQAMLEPYGKAPAEQCKTCGPCIMSWIGLAIVVLVLVVGAVY